jgi:hypothetical protein
MVASRQSVARRAPRAQEVHDHALHFEGGYSVKLGQEEAHQRWLEANEAALAASMPEGCKYLGTFVTVLSSEKRAGFYKTYFELDSYGRTGPASDREQGRGLGLRTPEPRVLGVRATTTMPRLERGPVQGGRRRHDLRSAGLKRVLSSRGRIGSS